jgi:hypothetical protein
VYLNRCGQALEALAGIWGTGMTTIFTVWIFKEDGTLECRFEEFADAKKFASAAEKIVDVKQVGVTNNESPEYLIVWTKPV